MKENALVANTHDSAESKNNLRQFRTLEQTHFSGHLKLSSSDQKTWDFYFIRGLIVYATGGTHPGRRWRRYLARYCPEIPIYVVAWQRDLDRISPGDFNINWEYALLKQWLTDQRITREQITCFVQAVVEEVLFEVAHAQDLSDEEWQEGLLCKPIATIDSQKAIASAAALFRAWEKANLTHISPHQAPVIRQVKKLEQLRTVKFYQKLTRILSTRHTLWDLAVKMQRSIVDVTAALTPCARSGIIELVDLPDLYVPKAPQSSPQVPAKKVTKPIPKSGALIACIDDSLWVQKMLEKLLISAGYQFLGVSDELRAISILLANKPDLIFLDLVMPKASGYEICEQLRKISRFRETPIIILTGNDGYANRLRSNFAGASDFLCKPLDAETVLNAIRKHLKQGVTIS